MRSVVKIDIVECESGGPNKFDCIETVRMMILKLWSSTPYVCSSDGSFRCASACR